MAKNMTLYLVIRKCSCFKELLFTLKQIILNVIMTFVSILLRGKLFHFDNNNVYVVQNVNLD